MFSTSTLALAVLAAAACVSGCVERELFINSDPPGALIFLDGVPAGETPASFPFHHYGTRSVELRLPKHHPVREEVAVHPPWYQIFPLDLFTDVLIPFTIEDTHVFERTLPAIDAEDLVDEQELLRRAEALRASS